MLAGVEVAQAALDAVSHHLGGRGLVGKHRLKLSGDVLRVARSKRHAVPVGRHELLDGLHRQVAAAAAACLLLHAKEVEVLVAVGLGDALEHHAGLDTAVVAGGAVERPLEVVRPLAHTLACHGARAHLCLDAREQFLRDEGLVAARELLALVGHLAEVVAVPEHCPQLRARQLGSRMTGGGLGAEPATCQLGGQALNAPLAGGVQLESELHVRRSLRVHGHRADLVSGARVADVEVADGGLAEGPSGAGLVRHLGLDVGTIGGRAVLVDRRQDAVSELSGRRLVDVLLCRDERDLERAQRQHDVGVIDAVASQTRQVVNDDVVDVSLLLDTRQHSLELRPVFHLGAGDTSLDVLVDDDGTKACGPTLTSEALGRKRDALRVVVGLDLAAT